MPKTITIADLQLISFRYDRLPEPKIFVEFRMLDEKGKPIKWLPAGQMLSLSESEAQKFESLVSNHILPRLRKEEGLSEQAN